MKEKPRQIKPQLDAKLEYYYGFGMGRYAEVLNELRIHGRVNSYRTSSIPLAECWQPENLETLTERLAPHLLGLDFKTNGPEGHKPVLIYQLFFDANDPVSREDRVAYEMELKKWSEMLRLKNMKFFIMSVPIINAAEVKANYSGLKDEIFEEMKMHTIYKFDFDSIAIEEVL